jgi:hypothetical protein
MKIRRIIMPVAKKKGVCKMKTTFDNTGHGDENAMHPNGDSATNGLAEICHLRTQNECEFFLSVSRSGMGGGKFGPKGEEVTGVEKIT